MVSFCHRLPEHLLRDRQAAISMLESENIYCFSTNYQKESFSDIQRFTLKKTSVEIFAEMKTSPLVDLGIINLDEFTKEFHKFLSAPSATPDFFVSTILMNGFLKKIYGTQRNVTIDPRGLARGRQNRFP